MMRRQIREVSDRNASAQSHWTSLGERLEVMRSDASACVRPLVGRVLVVEDEPDQRAMCVRALSNAGFEVSAVASGADAIETLRRRAFDVVLSDIGLPGSDGLALCGDVLCTGALPPIVVLLTGRGRNEDIVRGLEQGASEYVVKPVDPDVLVARIRAMLRLRNRLVERDQAANTDALTGLWNRTHFRTRSAELVADLRRTGRTCCSMMIDIDRFKAINDTHGHAAGDIVLRAVSDRIAEAIRRSDVLFRFGGEEFVVLAVDSEAAAAAALGDRIRRLVAARPVIVHSIEARVRSVVPTVSIGVASWARDRSIEDSVHDADAALYVAKAKGRNRVVTFEPAMRRASEE